MKQIKVTLYFSHFIFPIPVRYTFYKISIVRYIFYTEEYVANEKTGVKLK